MRTSSLLLALLAPIVLAFAVPARADEPPPGDTLFYNRTLDAKLATLKTWPQRWDAYRSLRAACAKEREALEPAHVAWERMEREGEGALTPEEHEAAFQWREYIAVRTRIAAALRRDDLSPAGWLMAFFAASLLWGGLAVTVTIAVRSERRKKAAAS